MRAGYGADAPPVWWVVGCVAQDDSGVRPTGGQGYVVLSCPAPGPLDSEAQKREKVAHHNSFWQPPLPASSPRLASCVAIERCPSPGVQRLRCLDNMQRR
jgi:hypothetical protein